MRAAAQTIALVMLPAGLWAEAPDVSPLPVPREPAEDVAAEPPATAPDEATPAEEMEERDPDTPADEAEEPAEVPPRIRVPAVLAEDDAEFFACLDELRQLGVEAEPVDPVSDDDGFCGIARPVRVSTAAPGVRLEPAAEMRCATARALGEWTQTFLLPASRLLPERGLVTAIDHGSAYVCRGRNSVEGAKPSEHSFGNALDIMGFRFADGPAIPVQPRERDGTPAEAFQDAARATACLSFTTVLGPGSDAAHADHLHLDIKERRGGFRLCQ